MPHNIEVLLHAVGILLTYGRHLIDTVRLRAATPNFNAIAACFGTSNLATILAHLNRGLLRALRPSNASFSPAPPPAATSPSSSAASARRKRKRNPPRPPPSPSRRTPPAHARFPPAQPAGTTQNSSMPTFQDLERQARRSPVGRTMLKICLDLAVVPGFCHSAFWNELFELITYFGSGVHKLMREKSRRREAFARQQDRKPHANWDWINASRDALRQVLGFFIGEPPVNPLDLAAAITPPPPP